MEALKEQLFDKLFEKRLNKGAFSTFHGLPHHKLNYEYCKQIVSFVESPKLDKIENWIDKKLEKAREKDLREYSRTLETLIRFLYTLKSDDNHSLNIKLAELLIERAKLLNPKGFGRNPKKENLLNKAVELLNKAIENKAHLKKAYKLKLQAYHELKREDKERNDHYSVLLEAVKRNPDSFSEPEFEWALIELAGNGKISKKEVSPVAESKDKAHRAMALSILGRKDEALKSFEEALEEVRSLYNNGELSFSHPVWDKLYQAAKILPGKEAAVSLWKLLRGFENTRKYHNLHILWYWSRLTDIYDLAFERAYQEGDYLTAFWIADGAKAKPMIQWQVLERILRKEGFEDLIEAEILGRSGYYVKRKLDAKTHRQTEKLQPFKPPEFELKEGITVVSFYLTKEGGFALVLKKSDVIAVHRFSPEGLWKQYLSFSEALSREDKAVKLNIDKICTELGDTFQWLFELDTERLVIIPHGFLHLLPIHGAYSRNHRRYLFEKFIITYLPSFELALKSQREKLPSPEGEVLIVDTQGFGIFIDKAGSAEIHENSVEIFSSQRILKKLTIACHGKANPANPFESTLKAGKGIALKDILTSRIKAEEVYLLACDSDLYFPVSEKIDEYPSMAAIFLLKQSRFVFSSLWEAQKDKLQKIYPILYRAEDKARALTNFLREKRLNKEPWEKSSRVRLTNILSFRIYDTDIFRG